MKTKRQSTQMPIFKFILVFFVSIFLLFALSSCAAKKKVGSDRTEIAPPPPPPPPPALNAAKPASNNSVTQAESEEEPYVVVEEMPMFPGGDEALLNYILINVKYPEEAKINKTEGKVIVRFCVTAKGNVDRVTVLRSVTPELDAEALRVVHNLPAFVPGKQGGKNVPVWYMVPINFALR